jgi:hypothetical protein
MAKFKVGDKDTNTTLTDGLLTINYVSTAGTYTNYLKVGDQKTNIPVDENGSIKVRIVT